VNLLESLLGSPAQQQYDQQLGWLLGQGGGPTGTLARPP
jgi:hypothetical protein